MGGLVILKAYGLHLQPGDEGIYFYLAGRMAEAGLTPYRDFFFAHPPVHLLVGAGAFKLFGASAWVGKAIPAVASLGTVTLVYGACLRRFGRVGAFVAGAVLVCSYDYLRASSHFTGVNVTLFLATAAAVASLAGRAGLGGALAGLAASAGLYALPTAFGCGVVCAGGGRRRLGRFALGLAAVVVVVDGGFWWVAGRDFVEQVWLYHLAKPGQAWAGAVMARRVLLDNLGPVAGGVLAITVGDWGRTLGPRERVAALALLLALGNLLALSTLQRAFPFYFLLVLPGLAVAAGYAGERLYGALGEAFDGRLGGAVALGLAALMLAATFTGARWARMKWHPRTVPATDRSYDWVDAEALPPVLNVAVRRLLWAGVREAGTEDVGVRRYLWHESRRWPLFADAAAYLTDHAPSARLFGGSLTAPYLAFLTGRRVAGDEADTNAARFRSRSSAPADVIAAVEADGPVRLVIRPGRGLHRVDEFRRWIGQKWRVERAWNEPRGGRLLLMRPR